MQLPLPLLLLVLLPTPFSPTSTHFLSLIRKTMGIYEITTKYNKIKHKVKQSHHFKEGQDESTQGKEPKRRHKTQRAIHSHTLGSQKVRN